jgi:predicted nucleic acid-binding protein
MRKHLIQFTMFQQWLFIHRRKVNMNILMEHVLEHRIIKSKKFLRYSDKEKTILDIAYREKLKGSIDGAISIISEYSEAINKTKMKEYFEHYPKSFKTLLQEYV